jgi:hypothetical protein
MLLFKQTEADQEGKKKVRMKRGRRGERGC